MKKVVLNAQDAASAKVAGQKLGTLSGVMSAYVEGSRITIYCGQKMPDSLLLDYAGQYGCSAAVDRQETL